MRLSRRGLLLASGVGISGVVALRFAASTPSQLIAEVLRNRLSYLKLEPTGVEAFARDLMESNLVAGDKLRILSATGLLQFPFEAVGFRPSALRLREERIITYYLLSTDFFLTGADQSRVVNYLGFYDPYKAACFNPFPRTVTGEEAA